MKKLQRGLFFSRLYRKREHFPFSGQIELTYRCNLDCIHCYCKGLEVRELTTEEWKKILDIIKDEGCINLCLTGGDPLVREDFLELYSYAKAKGFIIILFTNGQLLTPKIIAHLVKSPPFSIEITLNGITQKTYEAITQVPGSFQKVMRTIKALKERKLLFKLKTNCLKQNIEEIPKVKAFTQSLFDNLPRNKFLFGYGSEIHPRLNLDKTPIDCRLSFKELLEVRGKDPDIWKEYERGLHGKFPQLKRKRDFLYHCNSWMKDFFINPYGRLKFCLLSNNDKFSVDLKTTSFKQGFYGVFPQVLKEKFKTNSKCRVCRLRPICYHCPARAYLETGSEEAPVPYFCELAKGQYREMRKSVTRNTSHVTRHR